LVEEVGQDWRITDVTRGDLDRPDLQPFRVGAKVDLAPDPPFGASMLAG